MDHDPTCHDACKGVLETIQLTRPAGHNLDDVLLAGVQRIAHMPLHTFHDR